MASASFCGHYNSLWRWRWILVAKNLIVENNFKHNFFIRCDYHCSALVSKLHCAVVNSCDVCELTSEPYNSYKISHCTL